MSNQKKKKEDEILEQLRQGKYVSETQKKLKQSRENIQKQADENNIAPIKSTSGGGNNTGGEEKKWFQKIIKGSEAFDDVLAPFKDGYQFGDISKTKLNLTTATTKTILGTGANILSNVAKAPIDIGVNTGKAISAGVAQVADWIGQDEYAEKVRNRLAGKEELAFGLEENPLEKYPQELVEKTTANSVLDEFGQKIPYTISYMYSLKSGGDLLGKLGNIPVKLPKGKYLNMPTLAVMSGAGGAVTETYQKEDSNNFQDWANILGGGLVEGISEGLFGAFGVGGSSFDDMLSLFASKPFKSGLGKALAQLGVSSFGEGFEEIVSYVGDYAKGHAIDFISDKLGYEGTAEFGKDFNKDEMWESFWLAFISTALGGGANTTTNTVETATERIAQIEQETGKELTAKEKAEIRKQTLLDITLANEQRIAKEMQQGQAPTAEDIQAQIEEKEAELKESQDEREQQIIQDGINALEEDLAQVENTFTYEITENDSDYKKAVYESASQLLDNSEASHKIADTMAKLAEDRKVPYKFSNNEQIMQALQERGQDVSLLEGKTVNGFVHNGEILVNIDSPRFLETIMGHETTHLLEGTTEYEEFQKLAIEFAKKNGDYDSRVAKIQDVYDGIEADINNEITADIVGEYLFTNEQFLQELSVQKPTIFQKIKNLISDLIVRFKGTAQERQLRELQRKFESLYRNSESQTTEGIKFEVSQDNQGRQLTNEQRNYFKDSKVRDKDGNLMAVYHGTRGDFNEFETKRTGQNYEDGYSSLGRGSYFTNDKSIAEKFGEDSTNEGDLNIKETYIDIKNPFYADDIARNDSKVLKEISEKYGIKEAEMFDGYNIIRILRSQGVDSTAVLQEYGYDGIIAEDEYVVFDSKQVKNIDNAKPTESKDIRYSLSEDNKLNDYEQYLQSQEETLEKAKGISENLYDDLKENMEAEKQTIKGYLYRLTNSAPIRGIQEKDSFMSKNRSDIDDYNGQQVADGKVQVIYLKKGDNEAKLSITEGRDKLWIDELYVKNQKQGYGSEIVKAVKKYADEKGLIVEAYKELSSAKGFWDKTLRNNTKYSLSDNQGRKLSKEQQEYFKDSKIRDEKGNLLAVYHGTNKEFYIYETDKEGHTQYGKGSYFVSGYGIAEEYAQERAMGEENTKAQINENYLNITKPFDNTTSLSDTPERMRLYELLLEKGLTEREINNITNAEIDYPFELIQRYLNHGKLDWENSNEVNQLIRQAGYDGIIAIHGDSKQYVAFSPEQIKNVDNKKPTKKPDTRYSLSEDTEGNKLKPNVEKWAKNSKARDENGNLKVLYHGTATGEFTVFDKSKASPEGDWGSGFYLTDNETDVETNYEDGGSDFDNKIERLAERIEQEEDISYEEAKEKAKEQLYKGAYKITAYAKIENPAIVGETYIFNQEDYFDNYNQEDFESEEEYYEAVEQIVADDINQIIWKVETQYELWNSEELASVLWDAYAEGGIEIQDFKDRLNELEFIDDEGNLVNNDIARITLETLGFDGIIDNTVSSKFRMGIEEGTTHYIVFNSNQIKNVTNENPTENPDINLSLSDANEPTQAPIGNSNTLGRDIKLQVRQQVEEAIAPMQELVTDLVEQMKAIAPVQDAKIEENAPYEIQDAPMPLTDADVPPDFEDLSDVFDEVGETDVAPTIESPLEERDIDEVGNKKVKAYQYEHPEFRPYFQAEAQNMLHDLDNTIKGERIAIKDEAGYITEWAGTTRQTAEAIAYLKDNYGYSYDEIRKGLNAIIEDHGAENIAVAKRIEFLLDERLREGYTTSDGYEIPANEDYIKFLEEREITTLNSQGIDSLAVDSNIPPETNEDMPTVENTEEVVKDVAPVQNIPENPITEATEGKQRRWAKTSTDAESIRDEIQLDDLDVNKITYMPITNRGTLSSVNKKIETIGYDDALKEFRAKMISGKSIKAEDTTLGQRLMQEALKRGDKDTAIDLLQDITILGTEIGQAVQSLSIIQRMTPAGQLKMLEKVVKRAKAKGDKSFDDVVVTKEMKDKIMDSYDKGEITYDQDKLNRTMEEIKQELANQIKATKLDKVNAWRYLSMLGNIRTHLRNVVSNIAMFGTTKVKDVVSRTMETAGATIAPSKFETRTKTFRDSSEDVLKFAEQTTIEMKDIISGGGKVNDETGIKNLAKTFENKVLEKVYNFNSDLLEKEDWWFSGARFKTALSEFLTANGIKTEEDIFLNPELVEKGRQYALEQSRIATFRQYSYLANKLREIESKNVATNIVVGSVIPFKKTPINVAKTGLAYSPLAFVKTIVHDIPQVRKGNMEASQLVDNIAQGLTGSALLYAGYMLAMSGFLSGAGGDDEEAKYDYQLGKQTYSINIGGKSYSLSWLSPVAMPLMVGANLYEQLVESKEWNGDVVIETLGQTIDPMSEMSFVSGLMNVLSSYEQDDMLKLWGMFEAMGQSYLSQFIPTLSSQVANFLDDKKRTTKVASESTNRAIDETVNKLMLKIPGLREMLEPSTDIWGNEVKQTENMFQRAYESFIAPYTVKESTATEIDAEIKEVFRATGDSGVIPDVPKNTIKFDNETYKMSGEEYTDYKKMYGQTANRLLEELFNTTVYKESGADERADMIDDVYSYSADMAKKKQLLRDGVTYTNTTKDGKKIYKDNLIKKAIDHDMTKDEYKLYEEDPDKYQFLKDNGISFEEYDRNRDEYNYAYKNPERYAVATAITNYDAYKTYTKEINKFKSDYDKYGDRIDDSRKDKVFNYIDGLELSEVQRAMLKKLEYPSYDDYNNEIVDYVINLNLDYRTTTQILEEFDMWLDDDGYVYWK